MQRVEHIQCVGTCGRVVMACDSRSDLVGSAKTGVFSWALPAGVRIPSANHHVYLREKERLASCFWLASGHIEIQALAPPRARIDVAQYTLSPSPQNEKEIVVLARAGRSTAAGIPDFRTPETGLYVSLLSSLSAPGSEQSCRPRKTSSSCLSPGRTLTVLRACACASAVPDLVNSGSRPSEADDRAPCHVVAGGRAS
ncbi:hypothetical protein LZ554_003727 [Drepanopeziza brunnea f. sp. 'monogermtubi']|nr:hypothetical protein LZ554_003727 [Drepanopeziza brunnea f. sp. 'monogermtubi']